MGHKDERIERAVLRCPFMSVFSARWGRQAAERTVASALSGVKGLAPLDPETQDAFRMAHGQDGFVPIDIAKSDAAPQQASRAAACSAADSSSRPDTSTSSRRALGERLGLVLPQATPYEQHDQQLKALPDGAFAAISLSGFWGDFLNKGGKQQKPKKRSGDSKRSSGNSGGTRGNKGLSSVGSVRASAAFPPGSGRYAAMQPLVGVVISKSGHLQCPPPIVALRAALAQTSLCKGLRPQALPVKLAACGILSALANMPPGMVKEHFKKFSPLWILTVHISIPFVAALRKAVVLPPHAIACTIGGAIAGQVIGGKIEKLRLEHAAAQAEAIRRGDITPDDTPFMCKVLKVLANPWGATDGDSAPTAASSNSKATQRQAAQKSNGSVRGGVSLPARKRGNCAEDARVGQGLHKAPRMVASWVG